jgi:hypothetical protein
MADTPLKIEGVAADNKIKASDSVRERYAAIPPEKLTPDLLKELDHKKRPILKAIRSNCKDCSSGTYAEVRRCVMIDCPLWPYRFGTNPFRANGGADEPAN